MQQKHKDASSGYRWLHIVPRFAPSLAIRGDSGIFPLYVEGIASTVAFWNRVSKAPLKSLLAVALETQVQMADTNYECWMSELRAVSTNIFGDTPVDTLTKEQIVEGLKQDYRHHWYQALWVTKGRKEMCTHLKWYRQLKSSMGQETYLSGPKSEVQVAMARLRIGGHGPTNRNGKMGQDRGQPQNLTKMRLKRYR